MSQFSSIGQIFWENILILIRNLVEQLISNVALPIHSTLTNILKLVMVVLPTRNM